MKITYVQLKTFRLMTIDLIVSTLQNENKSAIAVVRSSVQFSIDVYERVSVRVLNYVLIK